MDFQTKWQQVTRVRMLPLSDMRIVAAAATLLPCTIVGLRLFGFKRWSVALNRWARLCQWGRIADDESRCIRRTLRLMAMALRYLPRRGNCLSQSLTLWWLLQCQGIESNLRIGVQSVGDQFQAHAWLEHQGQPVNEVQEVIGRFVDFLRDIAYGFEEAL